MLSGCACVQPHVPYLEPMQHGNYASCNAACHLMYLVIPAMMLNQACLELSLQIKQTVQGLKHLLLREDPIGSAAKV